MSFVAIAIAAVAPGCLAASFDLSPPVPKTGDNVAKTVTEVCASLDRVDRVTGRTIIYATGFALITGVCTAVPLAVNIASIARGRHLIQLYLRAEYQPVPPDGYEQRDYRDVEVADTPAGFGSPVSITSIGPPAQPISQKYPGESRPLLKFLIRDAQGRPVPRAYTRAVILTPRRPTEITLANLPFHDLSLIVSDSTGVATVGSDAMDAYVSETGELATFTLSLTDVPAMRRPPPAHSTVVKVSAARLVDAVPVIEYQYSPPSAFGRTQHYFLAADETSLRALDSNPQSLPEPTTASSPSRRVLATRFPFAVSSVMALTRDL